MARRHPRPVWRRKARCPALKSLFCRARRSGISARFPSTDNDAAKRTLLHFGAVDYACTVFVNGREAGGHTGGYCPFTLDITSFVRAAENELTVAVTDDTDKGDAPRGKQVLHPKGIWYTAVTGIWRLSGWSRWTVLTSHPFTSYRRWIRGGLRPDQRKRQRMHGSVGGGFMHHRPHVYGGRQPDGFV